LDLENRNFLVLNFIFKCGDTLLQLFPEKNSLQLIKTPAYIALGIIFLIFFWVVWILLTLCEAKNEMSLFMHVADLIILSLLFMPFLFIGQKNLAPRNTHTSALGSCAFW
jgi:hypothetical protein